jgi:heme exporter protein D
MLLDTHATMNFETFFHMGGYALYVWSSYGLAFAVLLVNLILPLRGQRQLIDSLERAQRQEARKQAGTATGGETPA